MIIGLLLATAWNFSVPEAPYSLDREVKDGVKATPVVTDKEIVIGSRSIGLQGAVLDVRANGMNLLHMRSNVEGGKGFISPDRFVVTVDKDGKGVRRVYSHEGRWMKDGKDYRFETTVRVMPNGEIEFTAFNPGPEPKRGCLQFDFSMPVSLWHDQWVSINEAQPFRIPSTAEEWLRTPYPKEARMSRSLYPAGSTFTFYKPDGKTPRFGFRLGENANGACINAGSATEVRLGFMVNDPAKPVKFYINLGDTRVPREKPHFVGDIDWRAENDFDVACWDETRNLFVNGGMESGTRYWKRDVRLSEDAHSGRYAMSGRVGFDSNVESVGTVLKPGKWYTVGLWAKVSDGKEALLGVGARGPTGPLKGFQVKLRETSDWQFVSGSLQAKDSTHEVKVAVASDWKRVVIDDLCLVEGSNAVATAVNPWGLELKTGAEDNLFVPAERKDGKIQLVVRGPKGAKAKLDISGGDLLGRKTITKAASVTIPDSGETLVDLGPDGAFPKGVNGIKVKLNPVRSTTTTSTSNYDSHPYTDYLRFNKAHWGDNKQKHRYLQMDMNGAPFVGGLKRLGRELYERKVKRNVMLGMGALNYTTTCIKPEHFTAEEQEILDRYGIVDLWGSVRGNLNWSRTINGKPWKWQGKEIGEFVEYPPEFLKWVEDEICAYAKQVPYRKFWSYASEPMGGHASLKAGRFDEYAKLMLAFNRGLKRANPENDFCPYGTYNMGTGTGEIAAALTAMSVVEPATHFRTIEVHSYRPFPEDPDVQQDLDTFFLRLSAAGYDDIQIKIGEGSYYFPMANSKCGLAPWSGVGNHDSYFGIVIPGYDLGYGEKIGAAMTTRETAIYYKNDKRVFSNCSWNPRWIDNDTPCGWLLANTSLLEMLGDATYLGEVRFAPKSRAMFFDDGHGALTVFMWRGDATFDMGQTSPVEAEIDFGDIKPEFYDLYANEVKVKGEGEGKRMVKIPLSGYPVYIKLPKEQIGKAKEFKRAIAETLVRADLNKLPLSCSLLLKDTTTVEVKAVNALSRTVKARVKVNGEDKGEMTVGGLKDATFTVKLEKPIAAEAYTSVKVPVEFVYEGKTFVETFETSAVVVGYVKGDKPDWTTVPAVDLESFANTWNPGPHKTKKDFNATVQLAWNEKHLWMKFKAKDDVLMLPKNSKDWKALGSDSDMVHVYIDGYANGREKLKRGLKGYDYDDFIFGIFPTSRNSAKVVRTRAPDHQLTAGADHGFKVGFEDHVKTEFAADDKGYELTLDFPAYYMMPVKLEAGGISPGVGIVVYDRDQDKFPPRVSVYNAKQGSSVNEHPENWPQLIFVK